MPEHDEFEKRVVERWRVRDSLDIQMNTAVDAKPQG